MELEHPQYPDAPKPTYRTQQGNHFKMSKYQPELTRVPLLGEHNEYVFKEICGLSDEEYNEMVEKGVLS